MICYRCRQEIETEEWTHVYSRKVYTTICGYCQKELQQFLNAEYECIVPECTNNRSQGHFHGDLCCPCYEKLMESKTNG